MNGHSGHGLSHIPAGGGANSRALVISGWLTGIYFVIELAIGLYTGSVAVISDAFLLLAVLSWRLLPPALLRARPINSTHLAVAELKLLAPYSTVRFCWSWLLL